MRNAHACYRMWYPIIYRYTFIILSRRMQTHDNFQPSSINAVWVKYTITNQGRRLTPMIWQWLTSDKLNISPHWIYMYVNTNDNPSSPCPIQPRLFGWCSAISTKLCSKTCLATVLIRSIFAREKFFQCKIERINTVARHVLLQSHICFLHKQQNREKCWWITNSKHKV